MSSIRFSEVPAPFKIFDKAPSEFSVDAIKGEVDGSSACDDSVGASGNSGGVTRGGEVVEAFELAFGIVGGVVAVVGVVESAVSGGGGDRIAELSTVSGGASPIDDERLEPLADRGSAGALVALAVVGDSIRDCGCARSLAEGSVAAGWDSVASAAGASFFEIDGS